MLYNLPCFAQTNIIDPRSAVATHPLNLVYKMRSAKGKANDSLLRFDLHVSAWVSRSDYSELKATAGCMVYHSELPCP